MKLPDLQAGFEKSILQREDGVLVRDIIADGFPVDERLDIHRNNCLITLSEALADNFPVVLKLVGQDFFDQMARDYIRRHAPKCPVLSEYGADFFTFIAHYKGAAGLDYLPDMARFEYLINRVSGDLDAAPLDPAVFQDVAPDDMGYLTFDFSENMRAFESPWPVLDIWQANQPGRDGAVNLEDGPCHVALTRPDFEVAFLVMDRAGFDFLHHLMDGLTLGHAVEQAAAEFDVSQALAMVFTGRIIENYTIEKDGK